MIVGYRITERFGPENGESWKKFLSFSDLDHLREVVGLDGILNPGLPGDWTAGDFEQFVPEWRLPGFFASPNRSDSIRMESWAIGSRDSISSMRSR